MDDFDLGKRAGTTGTSKSAGTGSKRLVRNFQCVPFYTV